jgi:hypothetical protein
VRAESLLVAAALLVAGCTKDEGGASPSGGFRCPRGLSPCGQGCIPAGAVCCDDGSRKTSSYCTNAAGGGCYGNGQRGCKAGFGGAAEYCCAANGDFGSNDCPAGQRHCGELCLPLDRPCCPEGSSADDCPIASADDRCGKGVSGLLVPCGYCPGIPFCTYCQPGQCCSADFCEPTTWQKPHCVSGDGVCTGIPGGGVPAVDGGAADGGSCAGGWIGSSRSCTPLGAGGSCTCVGETSTCITASQLAQVGLTLPAACAPEGTTDCLTRDGKLARPCCAGLTCAGSTACGQQAGATGVGQCVRR